MVLVFIWGLRSCAGCGSNKSIAPSAQEVVIDASDLWRAYDQNEVLADSQYKGKKIEVHGLIQDISVGLAGGAHISLQADPNNPLADVNCSMNDDQKDRVAKLSKGQPIVVRGTVEMKVIESVGLDGCEIVGG
jgi:hypothetical protein